MGAINGILDDLTARWWAASKKSIEDLCELESATIERQGDKSDPHIVPGKSLIAKDGSLISLFELDGSLRMMGPEEHESAIDTASRALTTMFQEPGHALHLCYEYDPQEGKSRVSAIMDQLGVAAGKLGLEFDDVLKERTRKLAPLIAAEKTTIAVWTRTGVLQRAQLKRDVKERTTHLKLWPARSAEAQCPDIVLHSLHARHQALAAAIPEIGRKAALSINMLNTVEGLRTIREMLNGPGYATDTWNPDIPGLRAHPPRVSPNISKEGRLAKMIRALVGEAEPDRNIEGTLHSPLAPQVIIKEPEPDRNTVTLGERCYAPIDMMLGPRQSRPFDELIGRISQAAIPFRFSILIEGGGLRSFIWKKIGATILAVTSGQTRNLKAALQTLKQLEDDGVAIARIRVSFVTWAPVGDDRLLEERRSRLTQMAESWGEMALSERTGDPLETLLSTIPGFACMSTAVPGGVPLAEAIRLLPFQRPASLGKRGSHVFRNEDGKLQLCDTVKETFSFELIYGKPGYGKSVLLSSLTLAFVLQEGLTKLPFSATIDIGPSSSGLISLIKEKLPVNRRHEAGLFKLQNTREQAINPFDTQLGCRKPLPIERMFLINLLTQILARPGEEQLESGLRDLITASIDTAYVQKCSPEKTGDHNLYAPRIINGVDEALERHSISLPPNPTWWEVVDILHEKGEDVAAGNAQRMAVPLATDMITAVRDVQIENLVGSATFGGSTELLTTAFTRILKAAANDWPILFNRTQFDIQNVRVAAIDLVDVAGDESLEGKRQTAVMYMLARHALTRNWWFDTDTLKYIPDNYRDYHESRMRDIKDTPKRLCYDEFHMTGASPGIVNQVESDARVIRKYGVHMQLSSQLLNDYSPNMRELASHYWILGTGGKEDEIERISREFKLSETLIDVIRHQLTGPSAKGSPVLLIVGSGRNRQEQLLVNSLGPIELWAFHTDPIEVALRNRLYEKLDPGMARHVLAKRFPNAVAEDEINRRITSYEERRQRAKANKQFVMDEMADELTTLAAHIIAGQDPIGAGHQEQEFKYA